MYRSAVSGVSTPISLIVSTSPLANRTSTVSPSVTSMTVATRASLGPGDSGVAVGVGVAVAVGVGEGVAVAVGVEVGVAVGEGVGVGVAVTVGVSDVEGTEVVVADVGVRVGVCVVDGTAVLIPVVGCPVGDAFVPPPGVPLHPARTSSTVREKAATVYRRAIQSMISSTRDKDDSRFGVPRQPVLPTTHSERDD